MAAIESADPAVALEGRGRYRALSRRKLLILVGMTVALCLSFAVDLAWGPARYGLDQVVLALIDPSAVSDQVRTVVWDIRMPIAVMAIVVGAALSVAGAQMQTILANPLASPFTLGISAAASFGAAIGIVTAVPLLPVAAGLIVPVNAFLMALVATLFIHFISQARGVTVQTVVLLGIALVFTFNALLAFLQYLASEQALSAVVFWTMGSLTKATWPKICDHPRRRPHRRAALCPQRLGADRASGSARTRPRALASTCATSGSRPCCWSRCSPPCRSSFVGTIGFVGLVGPHIARMILGEDQRYFLPGSILAGALLLSVTSIVSKSIIPGVVFPDRHHHRPRRRAVLLLPHHHDDAEVMVAIQLDGVGAYYGKKLTVSGVSTPPITTGEIVAVIGPNAAGKSTLFKRIAGLLKGPGEVGVEGSTRGNKAISYMPQDTSANAVLTVYESLLLARKQGQSLVGRRRRPGR